ncbi:hypothetical protein ACKFKF_03455 [Phormidesmis sp. 146-12]
MVFQNSRFCFCSLAISKPYRDLALELAKDLEKYAPETCFIVLTDQPKAFSQQKNVRAFYHQQQGVKCYHDKRFAIAKGLSLFETCIFIDADMRILEPLPLEMDWIKTPGLTARSCHSMTKQYAEIYAGTADAKLIKEFEVTQAAAQELGLSLDDPDTKFVYEYLICVTRDSGKEVDFLDWWDQLANYFELRGVYVGEGNAIGLAAAKAGMTARWGEMDGIHFFMDRTEGVRIKKGQSDPKKMAVYFERQNVLKYPQRSLSQKVILKLKQKIGEFYRLGRLQLVASRRLDTQLR